jgi:hypothetical protein
MMSIFCIGCFQIYSYQYIKECAAFLRILYHWHLFFRYHLFYQFKKAIMPNQKQDESNRDNGSTSKQSTDQQRSVNSEKGKQNQTNPGAQGQKGKENLTKGKMSHQAEEEDKRAGSRAND